MGISGGVSRGHSGAATRTSDNSLLPEGDLGGPWKLGWMQQAMFLSNLTFSSLASRTTSEQRASTVYAEDLFLEVT